MKEITAGKIRRSLRRFEDFANDLVRADMNTFDDRLNLLMEYCKTDQVFSVIHAQLMNAPNVDFDIWHKNVLSTTRSMVGSGNLTFPTNLEERMALMYQLLYKINAKEIDLFDFAHIFFATGDNRLDSDIYAFNEAIVGPLARELSYRIEDNVIQQSAVGSNIEQSASIQEHDKLIELFTELRHELHEAIGEKDELDEALQVVKTSEELAQKGSSSLSSLKVLLGSLGALGNIGSITSAIITIISNMG